MFKMMAFIIFYFLYYAFILSRTHALSISELSSPSKILNFLGVGCVNYSYSFVQRLVLNKYL